ncbi:hypothetical protein V6N13_064005 [Hibiscus sabdariffa]|uniref:Uncharacterized protein n=2 Tax=Hibiscus sabdariffa TaxID=183260 RepID=A0ABR2R1V8_9ROSI
MAKNDYVPLFETKQVKGRILFRSIAASILLGICFICTYRLRFFPVGGKAERLAWIGLFLSELWFSVYWFLISVSRWDSVHRIPYVHRLTQRFGKELPGVDIFVCTADPLLEPPSMVVSTVLSVMAYDYPPEKLSIYLSDDGGSDLTFYAMLEAADFSKTWLPFCSKFKVEPRSPEAYFRTASEPVNDQVNVQHWLSVKVLHLQNNSFSGQFNHSIDYLSSLVELDISSSSFSGVLPDVFASLGKLEKFSACSNNFNGTLPVSLLNSPLITSLDLQNNSLNGPVNLKCSVMVHLKSLRLASNNFNGSILHSLFSCKNLTMLNFGHNNLDGQIPESFKNLKALTVFSLSRTNLVNLSSTLNFLQHCKNLIVLLLSENFQEKEILSDPDF